MILGLRVQLRKRGYEDEEWVAVSVGGGDVWGGDVGGDGVSGVAEVSGEAAGAEYVGAGSAAVGLWRRAEGEVGCVHGDQR